MRKLVARRVSELLGGLSHPKTASNNAKAF